MTNLFINATTKQIYYVCLIFLPFIVNGICRAYIAFLFHQLDAKESPIILSNVEKSWLASFSSLLSPLGCIIAGISMDLTGRKYTLQFIYLPYIISFALLYYAKNVEMLYISSLLQGVAIGMNFCVIIYVTEICTNRYRGALFCIYEIYYNLGILISNTIMYSLNWKLVAYMFAIFSVMAATFSFFLPESPLWLYLGGKKEISIMTLRKLRCNDERQLITEISDLEKTCAKKQKSDIWKIMGNVCTAWKQLLLLISLFILAVNTGYVTMAVFPIMILNDLNLPYNSDQITVTYSVVGFIASFIMPFFVQKYSRKVVVIISSFGMGLGYLFVILFRRLDHVTYGNYVWIIPLSFYLVSFAASLGVIPISFLMGGELLPSESKGVLSGIYGIISFLYLSLLCKVQPIILKEWGVTILLWSLAISSFALTLFAIFILPETKGKSLNEIQEDYFRKNKKIDVKI